MKKILIFLTIAAPLFIISCKEDDITNNNKETLIFSRDSISVFTADSGSVLLDDSFEEYFYHVNNFKIEFDGETNIDSLDADFLGQVNAADSAYNTFALSKRLRTKAEVNKHHIYSGTLNFPVSSMNSHVEISVKYNNKFCYLRFRNIKIYSLN